MKGATVVVHDTKSRTLYTTAMYINMTVVDESASSSSL